LLTASPIFSHTWKDILNYGETHGGKLVL